MVALEGDTTHYGFRTPASQPEFVTDIQVEFGDCFTCGIEISLEYMGFLENYFHPHDFFSVACFEVDANGNPNGDTGLIAMGQVANNGIAVSDSYYGQFKLEKTPLYRSFADNFELSYPETEEQNIFSAEPFTMLFNNKLSFKATALGGIHKDWRRGQLTFQCWQYTGHEPFDIYTFSGYKQANQATIDLEQCINEYEIDLFLS